ncbi:hydrogenase maturation protease [Streptomyces sp. NPDC050560]|uniref:hydrogenase maturation protease n=1 Tax=Streptomyces sp. NPDC050560 TaxID=3365630 RepID=UPI0037BCF371
MSGVGATAPGAGRVLVAGLGNIFLGDDGFGVAAVAALAQHPLPPRVETADIGVRGVHLAYRLLDGYETVLLLDATARGGKPGTVYLIEDAVASGEGAVVDGHRMTPDAVLALLGTLCDSTGGTRPGRVLVVGCEPACLDEGIGLSGPVTAAVDEAAALVLRLLAADTRRPAPPVERTKETQP